MIREALKTGRVAMASPLSVPAVSLRGTPKTGIKAQGSAW
jgi:hypothetical protein